MSARRLIYAVSLCLISSMAFASPSEKPHRGKPADQETLDLNAMFTDESQTIADGNISDWGDTSPIAFKTLISGEYEYDWTGPKDLSARVSAQYGPTKIYFLIQVRDNAVVDKRRQWKSDRVEIWLAPEDAQGKSLGSMRGILMDIGPMVSGGDAKIKFIKGKQAGLSGAGYIGNDGYDFEIAVDYAAFGKKSPVMDGTMRYAVLVRDWDQDDPNEDEAAIATAPINPRKPASIKRSKMGKIPLGLSREMWNMLSQNDPMFAQNEWTRTEADIAGTSTPEIIAVTSDRLVLAGIGLDTSSLSYSAISLPKAHDNAPQEISIKDVNGDKLKDIILKRTEHCTNGNMTASRVYVFTYKNNTLSLLTTYIEKQDDPESKEFIRNQYKLSKKGVSQKLDPKSSKTMPVCTLSIDGDLIPLITHADGKKSRITPYAAPQNVTGAGEASP